MLVGQGYPSARGYPSVSRRALLARPVLAPRVTLAHYQRIPSKPLVIVEIASRFLLLRVAGFGLLH